MSESDVGADLGASGGIPEGVAVSSASGLAQLVEELSHVGACGERPTGLTGITAPTRLLPGEQLELVEELERLKSAAAAAQVRLTAAFVADETRRVEGERAAPRRGRTLPRGELVVGAQVGLARHESPARGRRHAEAAVLLVRDLPHTLAALSRGEIDEERAMLVVRATQDLAPDGRRAVDARLGGAEGPADSADSAGAASGGTGRMGAMGLEALRRAVQRLAFCVDDEVATRRMRRARAERRVTGRMLDDGTGRITAVVPAEHYTRIRTALSEAAAAAKASGDSRTRDQIRADVFTTRLTGQETTTPTPVVANLVIGVESLLGHSSEPGQLLGATRGRTSGNGAPGGYLPAGLCADLVLESASGHRAALRRLFTAPDTGELVAMERTSRLFDWHLAMMINVRDGGTCRTRWCDAPIRHTDHVVAHHDRGATSYANGQGLCEACNLVKETPGWTTWAGTGPDGRHEVTTVTPHQHLHTTTPPPLPVTPARHRQARRRTGVPPGTRWPDDEGRSNQEVQLGTVLELSLAV